MRILSSVSRALVRAGVRQGLVVRPLLLVANPRRLSGRLFTSTVGRFTYSGDLGNWIDWSVYFLGHYEGALLDLLPRLPIDFNSTCLDVGANTGVHTLRYSTYFDDVIAIEPMPHLVDEVRQKLEINRIGNVTVRTLALGSRTETAILYPAPVANRGMNTFHPARLRPEDIHPLEVQVRRGDELVNDAGQPHIGMIEIDTEGHEIEALKGFKDCIKTRRPVIFVELSPSSHDFRSTSGFLELVAPDNRPRNCRSPRRFTDPQS